MTLIAAEHHQSLITQELTILAKNRSSCIGQGWDDLELGQGAGRSDGRAAQTREVVAIRACNTLDQAKGSQAMQLTRLAVFADMGASLIVVFNGLRLLRK